MSEGYLTWRYLRSFSFALFFVALALYLQAKSRAKGIARIDAEKRYPRITRFLVSIGFLEDFAARAVSSGCATHRPPQMWWG